MSKKESGKTALEVVDKEGKTVRVFTRDAHGKEMEALAESFAEKFGHKVK